MLIFENFKRCTFSVKKLVISNFCEKNFLRKIFVNFSALKRVIFSLSKKFPLKSQKGQT